MATTANDLIAGALRLISSVTPGEAIQGDEASNALIVLNTMLSSWSAENFLIPFRTIESFNLIVNQQSYTIGQNGSPDFNTVRPDEITNMWIHDTISGVDYGMGLYTKDQYEAIPLKTIATIPRWLYYDTQYPNGIIYIFPTSALSTYQLNIESRKPIMQFSTLSTAMILPGEYIKTIKFLLADEIAPEYGYPVQVGSKLDEQIKEARKFIKRKNVKRVIAGFDAGLRSTRKTGNIISGWI